MIGSLTLPAIAFVAAISGLPGLPGLKGLPTPQTKEHARAKAQAVAADTLPPPWRPSWRLALEHRFVRAGLAPIGLPQGPIRLGLAYDPRKASISVDPDSGIYRSTIEVGDVELGVGFRQPLSQFARDFAASSFHEHWLQSSRTNLNSLGQETPLQRTGISLPIPVRLPQRLSSILGPGGPALNVSGSESIRLSGTSNWTNQQLGVIGQRKSLFPSLDMQQDLDIRLEGQLSDRIKVNLLQNSANQVPLANRIAINYRGDEDDFIQAVDLGNTNLSLPGTQYVSYSGKNEGLFGAKLASRIGALDFTALASKQEGRSERAVYSGGAARSQAPFTDLDWVKGQYFLLYDPSFGTVYDVDQSSIRLYLDDAIATNNQGQVTPGLAFVDPNHAMGLPPSVAPDTAFVRGTFNILNAGPDQQYEVLNNLYQFGDTVFRVIRLKQPIPVQSDQVLAVTYRCSPIIGPGKQLGAPIDVGGNVISAGPDSSAIVMKLLRVPRARQTPTTDGLKYDTTAVFASVRELELKNVYNLGGFQIDRRSFKLTLKHGQDDPPVDQLNGIPLIEMLGIDSWDETTDQAFFGRHDAVVDGNARFNYRGSSQQAGWVDFANGTLFLPDPRPFAPRATGPGARSFDAFLAGLVSRRDTLDGAPSAANAPNPNAYDLYNPRTFDAQYYFLADFAAQRTGGGDITLGRGNILENSEAVVVNGERWTRDRDYTIDYDLGRVTLKRQLGPADQLSIDYSYAPLFAQASKTLVGSAFRLEGRDRSLGGAFLYESKGAQDIRPRLGEEPSRTLITDLNTEWRFKPGFLTRLADALPGVRTTTPSEFDIQAEGGLSFPNPNTKNEVFVDDMEGVRDAVSLSLTPTNWHWSSVPHRATDVVDGNAVATESFLNLPKQKYAEIHWYVPVSSSGSTGPELVHEHDLRPKLEDGQGGVNVRTVLAVSIPQRPHLAADYTDGDTLWSGLTYSLDPVGLDLSRSQFIEIWVDDWNDHHDPAVRDPRVRGNNTPGSGVKLHLDLGRVSEDQMRAPNRLPNGRLDTEEKGQPDGVLTVVGGNSEDTGLDGINDAQERAKLASDPTYTIADLTTASALDPEGDDWGGLNTSVRSAMDPRRYLVTNGTEGNKDAYPIPDTEDLNQNARVDTTEAYFEYTIDLADPSSPYLVSDVIRDFPGRAPVDSSNGWRRYRIPISDSLRVRFGAPDLSIAQHMRVWIEGLMKADDSTRAVDRRPLLMIGGLDIVGSRWQATDLTPRQRDTLRTTMTLNSVNTADNAEIYAPPFDPGTTRNGSQPFTRREQSIALEFTDLWPTDSLEAFRTFSIPENYSRYGVLRWFASSFEVTRRDVNGTQLGTYDPATDSLYYFVRFASDDKGNSYYEIKRRLPRSSSPSPAGRPPAIAWEEVKAELEKLSVVKLEPNFPQFDPILFRTRLANGDSLILKGRPSFTRLLRISIGVENESSTRRYTGQLWFDELRATDVAKDIGFANRVTVNGSWANLMDYNVAWNSRDADFLSVGESRGSGSRNTSLAVSTRFEPHRFIEGTGILLPVSFTQTETGSRPRFSAGDDIVRSGALAAASETRNVARALTASYSRVWSDRSNPFLRYTLGGITANISRSTNDAHAPTALGIAFSKSTTVNGSVAYTVAPRELLPVPLPFTRVRLYPLPERFYWNYGVTTTKSSAFTQLTANDSILPAPSQNGRAASVDFGADSRPFDLITHHIEGRRNLALDGVRLDRIGFINLGRVTSWRQSFTSRLSLNPSPWFRPSFNWTSNYNQNNDTQSPNLSARSIGNGQDLGVNWDLPFDRLGSAGGLGVSGVPPLPPSPADTTRKAAKPHRPAFKWRELLSHLGPIGTDGRIGRSSNYTRLTGTASPLYLVGLAENPGFGGGRILPLGGNTSATGVDWRGNARTTIPLAFGSSLATRASVGDRTNNSNGVKTRSRDWRFPDVEVNYGQVANVIGLTHFLEGPQLRTAYARSYSVDYQNSRRTRSSTSRSDEFRPLLAVRGRFKNGTDADLRLERRSTVRETFQLGNARQTDQTTDINFSLTRSYSQGQKVNLLGKTTTVKTNVNLSLTTVYSRQKGGIQVAGQDVLTNPIDRTRLSVNGTGTYGFSSNVTGDLSLGFSHFRETSGIIRRSIRVEMRGQFRF